jgi:hypothetical protein
MEAWPRSAWTWAGSAPPWQLGREQCSNHAAATAAPGAAPVPRRGRARRAPEPPGLWLWRLAAGLLKLPSLTGPAGRTFTAGSGWRRVAAGVAACLPARFLVRYFRTRMLILFAAGCLVGA